MSRHHLPPPEQVELMRRSYAQLIDPRQIPLPQASIIRAPEIQMQIYRTMFQDDAMPFPPPSRYQLRVLKRVVQVIEEAVGASEDPEEYELSADLASTLASLMAQPSIDPLTAATQKHYVNYTLPNQPLAIGTSRSLESCETFPPFASSDSTSAQKVALASPGLSEVASITLQESQDVLASAGTTGRRTWEAALHLGSVLLTSPQWRERIAGATIIELGAGTGFMTVLCAKHLHAKFILSTDGSHEVVDDLERNLFLNELEGTGSVETAVLKWGHSLIGEISDGKDEDTGRRVYDLVLGSDLIYDPSTLPALVATIAQFIGRNTKAQALVSATERNERTIELFEQLCSASAASNTLVYPQTDVE